MESPFKILLADDHVMFRRGVRSMIQGMDGVEVVGEAGDGLELLRLLKDIHPHLVIMDISMPKLRGLEATREIKILNPEIKVLILSMHGNTDQVLRILQSGARGYVLKDAPPEELVRAIETVHGGQAYFSADVARVALNQFVRGNGEASGPRHLTNREREVLILIADGLSNKEIACQLGVGVRTVETHRERIMRKLDIHNVAGLTKFAIARGLVSLGTAVAA